MKYIAAALALLLMATAVQSQNTIDKQGRKQGHWIKTDKDGSKIFEGNFKDGVEQGTFTYFYPTGKMRMKNVFEADGKRCYHEAYDTAGRKIADGYYEQKNRDGLWHFFATDGHLVMQTTYRMGVKQGEQVIFEANGDTAEVSNWLDGKRHGRWWKRVGKQGYITATYQNGGLEGEMNEVDDSLRLAHHGFYHNGQKDGKFEHYENGVLSVKEVYGNGYLVSREVRIMRPETDFISIFNIACLAPKGTAMNKVMIVTRTGEKIDTYEPADALYYRIGNEHFFVANKNQRLMVASDCVHGVITEADGSKYLDMLPNPGFKIYPDKDCLKAVESTLRGSDGMPEE